MHRHTRSSTAPWVRIESSAPKLVAMLALGSHAPRSSSRRYQSVPRRESGRPGPPMLPLVRRLGLAFLAQALQEIGKTVEDGK